LAPLDLNVVNPATAATCPEAGGARPARPEATSDDWLVASRVWKWHANCLLTGKMDA
jgi:hypothetical protein